LNIYLSISAVEKVLKKRPIKIKKKSVDVEPYHSPYTVKLKGPPLSWASVDEPAKCLEKSCGEVSCIAFLSEESGTMYVTFKDEKGLIFYVHTSSEISPFPDFNILFINAYNII
jgi:hypothetical protein